MRCEKCLSTNIEPIYIMGQREPMCGLCRDCGWYTKILTFIEEVDKILGGGVIINDRGYKR